jgi:hypothetical protein
MMKLRQCGETWVSQENGHFSLNNGSNSSWIRNSAISYEKKIYKFDLYKNTRKGCLYIYESANTSNVYLQCVRIFYYRSVKIHVGILYIKIRK